MIVGAHVCVWKLVIWETLLLPILDKELSLSLPAFDAVWRSGLHNSCDQTARPPAILPCVWRWTVHHWAHWLRAVLRGQGHGQGLCLFCVWCNFWCWVVVIGCAGWELIDYKQFCGAGATDKVCACSTSATVSGVGLLAFRMLGGVWLICSSIVDQTAWKNNNNGGDC